MSLPNPRLREHFAKIRADGKKKKMNEARIPILMYLIMAANTRLRAWHGVDTIMTDTGYSKSVVTDVLSYLQSVGAMYNVPIEHRVGQEKTIHGNRKVWQMTGIMAIGSEIIDYLYIKDSDRTSAYQEIAEHAPDEVKALYARLGAIDLGSQNEPISTEEISSQNEPKVIQFGSQNGLEIGSQNDTAKEVNTNKRIQEKDNTPVACSIIETKINPSPVSQMNGLVLDTSRLPKVQLTDKDLNKRVRAIITTYLKVSGVIKSNAHAVWNADARQLVLHGIDNKQVAKFVAEKQKEPFFKDKPVTWGVVTGQIVSWVRAYEAQQAKAAQPDLHAQWGVTPDDYMLPDLYDSPFDLKYPDEKRAG